MVKKNLKIWNNLKKSQKFHKNREKKIQKSKYPNNKKKFKKSKKSTHKKSINPPPKKNKNCKKWSKNPKKKDVKSSKNKFFKLNSFWKTKMQKKERKNDILLVFQYEEDAR